MMPGTYLSPSPLSASILLLLQFKLKATPGPIQGDLMLENPRENVHMGAGAWCPGFAIRYHQLPTRSTKNGAIIYANGCNRKLPPLV